MSRASIADMMDLRQRTRIRARYFPANFRCRSCECWTGQDDSV